MREQAKNWIQLIYKIKKYLNHQKKRYFWISFNLLLLVSMIIIAALQDHLSIYDGITVYSVITFAMAGVSLIFKMGFGERLYVSTKNVIENKRVKIDNKIKNEKHKPKLLSEETQRKKQAASDKIFSYFGLIYSVSFLAIASLIYFI